MVKHTSAAIGIGDHATDARLRTDEGSCQVAVGICVEHIVVADGYHFAVFYPTIEAVSTIGMGRDRNHTSSWISTISTEGAARCWGSVEGDGIIPWSEPCHQSSVLRNGKSVFRLMRIWNRPQRIVIPS